MTEFVLNLYNYKIMINLALVIPAKKKAGLYLQCLRKLKILTVKKSLFFESDKRK